MTGQRSGTLHINVSYILNGTIQVLASQNNIYMEETFVPFPFSTLSSNSEGQRQLPIDAFMTANSMKFLQDFFLVHRDPYQFDVR